MLAGAARWFQQVDQALTGDVLVMDAGRSQLHLGVKSERGIIHADLRRRRVVETRGEAVWPVIAVLRRKQEQG